MSTFTYESRVDAPLDEVWEFHSTTDGLVELTPGWMNLTVEETRDPDGKPNPDVLEKGAEVDVSVKPLGVLPRVTWRSVILERDRDDGRAYFVDRMENGPFKSWEHTHGFEGDGDGTVVRDTVEYALPLWMLGRAGSPAFRLNARLMFRYRHRRTRELLG
ncbi:SRPBCC family protein [Haladaptatus sp. F3-133]|uniref:SRPBCC family protein n=1 Tax=Halorutilus salinus TaxID=2487751 RepID=A0A9Q4C7Q9_9EURY|nr:SRPBCC family protein [Halorutilus salinus]MCX2819954.1 SRPBCC family protein [Halorutilus salinus]